MKRDLLGDSWYFVGKKFTTFENPKSGPKKGATPYAGTNTDVENAIYKGIQQAAEVFRVPCGDLYLRQRNIIRCSMLANPLCDIGFACAIGKNLYSSEHVDKGDAGFTMRLVDFL